VVLLRKSIPQNPNLQTAVEHGVSFTKALKVFMEVEILKKIPISGTFEEHIFSISRDVLWVKFLDSDYLEWVGTFDLGESYKSTFVYIEPHALSQCFVVARGQGYFVSINERKVLARTKWSSIESAVYNTTENCWVISNGLYLGILKNMELEWSSERISLDGITFTSQNGEVVGGVLNDLTDQGGPFEFNIKTKEIIAPWLFYEAANKSLQHRSASLHWTVFKSRFYGLLRKIFHKTTT
jgi:hypothetical protein